MTDPKTVVRLRDDVRWRMVGDEPVVVRLDSAEVLVLNEVGGLIIGLLDGTRSLADVVTAVQDEFEVEPEQAEQDVLAYIAELLEAGVVELS